MFDFLKKNKALLDEDIIEWILDTYTWALANLNREVLLNQSVLVLPNNEFFPGKETTADGMAELIFKQVKEYANMAHWPTQLFNLELTQNRLPPQASFKVEGSLRSGNERIRFIQSPDSLSLNVFSSYPQSQELSKNISVVPSQNAINFAFHPQQLKDPSGVIAHFSQGLALHLVTSAKSPPPGGKDYIPMAAELTAIFMGFGIMFANSAHIRADRSCGSCHTGPVRQILLSDREAAYALAVFCHIKQLSASQVTKHLKPHLRGFFKEALKDCNKQLINQSLSN